MRRSVIGMLMAVGLAMPGLAQPATPEGQDLQQAAQLLGHEYDEAYNSKNAPGMASLYTEDGTLVPPGRLPVHGRANLTTYYQGRFDPGATGHVTRINEVHRLGDAGFGIGQFNVTAPGPNGAAHEVHGNLVDIYQHGTDGWKLRLVVANPLPNR